MPNTHAICSVEEAIEELRQGRMIVLVDDEHRENEGDVVIAAEGLRSARNAFHRLTGKAGVEDVLDHLFGRFCLGK